MGFIFDGLLGGTITLAVLYILLSSYIYQRLLWVQSNSTAGLNVRKLFVMTLLLTAIVRSMSFISMTLLSLASVDFKLENGTINDDESQSADKDFFNKAAVALFDFPDFYFVSAYVLLVIVWAETYLKSRRHWLSARRFHSFWIWSYFLFNVLLYTCQVALYSLLFLPTIDHYVEANLIYICLAAFNICLPLCWLVLFLYLTLVFSGFPHSSPEAMERLRVLSRLIVIWTTTRLGWGVIALSSVLQNWITEVHKSATFYTIVLVCIFIFAEIIPMVISLKRSTLQSLAGTEPSVTSSDVTPSRTFQHGAAMDQFSPLLPGDVKGMEDKDDASMSSVSSDQFHAARQSFVTHPVGGRSSRMPSRVSSTGEHLSYLTLSERDSESYASAIGSGPQGSPTLWERINIFNL